MQRAVYQANEVPHETGECYSLDYYSDFFGSIRQRLLQDIMPSREYGTINGPVGSFYKADNPQLNDDVKAVLIEYSGIPESQLVPHVREVVCMS